MVFNEIGDATSSFLLRDFSSKLTWFSSKFTSLCQRLQVRYVSYFRKKICLCGEVNPGLQGGSQMTKPLDQLNLSWKLYVILPYLYEGNILFWIGKFSKIFWKFSKNFWKFSKQLKIWKFLKNLIFFENFKKSKKKLKKKLVQGSGSVSFRI